MSAEKRLLEILRHSSSPMKAGEIASRMEIHKSEVNAFLYRFETIGLARHDEEYRWHLTFGSY